MNYTLVFDLYSRDGRLICVTPCLRYAIKQEDQGGCRFKIRLVWA